MNFWAISDTHFGHKTSNRVVGFEKAIIKNVKSSVSKDDVLIHLGDFAFYDEGDWCDLYNSTFKNNIKWLIRGNHDKKSDEYYIKKGFCIVSDRVDLTILKTQVILTHSPIECGPFNIHGHIHDKIYPCNYISSNHFLVSMERSWYFPYNLKTIIKERNEKVFN